MGNPGLMILYHHTQKEYLPSIFEKGLIPNDIGIVYLTPLQENVICGTDVVLEVETGDIKLTAFEGCEEWEVLCWGRVPPKNIKIFKK